MFEATISYSRKQVSLRYIELSGNKQSFEDIVHYVS